MNEENIDNASVGKCQSLVSLLWPSFLVAGVATIVFFTVFDPIEMTPIVSRTGAYTIGFFLFWLTGILSSAGTQYFMKPCDLVKARRDS